MNAKMCLMVLAAGLILPGCATTSDSAYVPSQRQTAPSTKYSPRIETDDAYVAQVERIARRRGISVHWIHSPTKRTVDVASED